MKPEVLKKLFFQMLRIRILEEKIAELYSEREMRCPVHLSIGQEAIGAGVCANLTPKDYVLSNHRSHAHYLAKGGNLNAMVAEIYGKETGCCKGKGGSMHLVDISAGFLGALPIVASSIPIAVGVAFGSMMRREKRVTTVFFGDGAIEQGVVHESINFAVLKNLPVVFVCENNMYSVYSQFSVRQPAGREIFKLFAGHGIDSYQGDGNNVMEVYQMAEQAVRKAKSGNGPTFLEFKTYRWLEHCGPNYDNDIGYRTESEFQEWKQHCPLRRLKDHLLDNGILFNKGVDDMERKIIIEIDNAIAFAKESLFPDDQLLLQDIYDL
jgi:pyruvate dehydrogenase E1 component alpha subunit